MSRGAPSLELVAGADGSALVAVYVVKAILVLSAAELAELVTRDAELYRLAIGRGKWLRRSRTTARREEEGTWLH